MVWVLLVSLLLLSLVALIKTMILSVRGFHHWRTKPAIYKVFFYQALYPSDQTHQTIKNLDPETAEEGTQEAFEGRCLYLSF